MLSTLPVRGCDSENYARWNDCSVHSMNGYLETFSTGSTSISSAFTSNEHLLTLLSRSLSLMRNKQAVFKFIGKDSYVFLLLLKGAIRSLMDWFGYQVFTKTKKALSIKMV
jgi:hypothetical protein